MAALAQLTAATTGILTTDAKDGPFGFCHFAARPGDLVALDTFYVGKPRGHRPGLAADGGRHRHPLWDRCPGRRGQVGPGRRQLRRPRRRTAGRHRGRACRGADRQRPRVHRQGVHQPLEELGVRHRRIPPRSPNHNAVCERFQGTALQEFYRPAFHRQHFARLADLNASSRAGCRPTTPAVATTATSCVAARPLRSWRPTHHDHAKGPPVTSTRAQEALDAPHTSAGG